VRSVPAIRLVFLLLGAAIATVFPFIAVILASRGFDPSGIGLVTAAAALAFTFAVPIWGHLGDVVLGRRRALALGALLGAAAMVVFGLPIPALAIGAAYVMFVLGESGAAPLADALAMNEIASSGRGSYATIRLLTSASYAAVAIVAGFAFDRTGYGPVPLLAAAMYTLLAIAVTFAPDAPRAVIGPGARRSGGSVRAAFSAAPRLPGVLVVLFLTYLGAVASFTYLPLRIQQLGGSPSDIALAAGASAAVEVPAFVLAGWLVTRIGPRSLFVMSGVVYVLALVGYAVLGTPGPLIAIRILTGFGWAAITVASVVTMALLLPPVLQATGQGLIATTASGVGGVVAGLVGGIVYQHAGPEALFLGLALVSVAGIATGWFVMPGLVRIRPAAPSAGSGGAGMRDAGAEGEDTDTQPRVADDPVPATMSLDAGSEEA
jgi:MFS transporter, PPP family, 3-phenylpropionic acid transporter